MQSPNKPAQRDAMIQGLEAAPRLACRRHINQREQYASDNLDHEARERGAAENIEPAGSFTRNRVFGRVANQRAHLQPQIQPLPKFADQAHVASPRAVLAARPGVGIAPALIRIFPSSILWVY